MLKEERIWRIAQELTDNGKVLVHELAKKFLVSPATIRLDLSEMELRGIAKKVYGGAIFKKPENQNIKFTEEFFNERLNVNYEEKVAIGKLAASLISDGETIMIDGGTTTYQLCKNLTSKNDLSIITCAFFNLWPELVISHNLQLFVLGGFLRKESRSLVGEICEDMINNFRASKYFMGIDGISLENGLTALNFQEASLKRKFIKSSQELIVISDHTKFGRVCPIPVAELVNVSKIITDAGIPHDFRSALEKKGIEILIANPDVIT